MFKLFNLRRKAATQELARQLTLFDRRAQEYPGTPPGPLPYSTYDLMQRDSMVQTVMSVKKQGVLAAKHSIVPASSSASARRNAEFVEESLARMEGSAATILAQAMDAFAKGWSVQEAVYEPVGSLLMLQAVRAKDPSSFGLKVDEFGVVTGLRLEASLAGDQRPSSSALPRAKFVIYANRGGYGRPKGRSDLDAAYPHWQAKTRLLDAWRLHLEKFASPTVLGKVQRGIPAEEQASLLAALEGLARRSAIVYPNEIEIGVLSGGRESNAGFMDAIEFHNREIARSVLGQTLTTDEGRRVGSLALGKVHLQVFLLQLQALRKELADVVMTEQVIRPLVELNFGPGEIPRFEFEEVALEAFASGSL
ncbi:MAG: DUF935 family protein [Chlorobia bacterium]|nr:DUF935 family protein [Fimbriimonadaceae bacterium]